MIIDGIEIKIKKTSRKTVGLKVSRFGEVTAYAPKQARDGAIKEVILKNITWIKSTRDEMLSRTENISLAPFTEAELEGIMRLAKQSLPKKLERLSRMYGFHFEDVKVKLLKSRWGSCTSKKSITINALLMLAPEEVREYVCIHELCHTRHFDHSREFWDAVKNYSPNYESCKDWLKKEGALLIERTRR